MNVIMTKGIIKCRVLSILGLQSIYSMGNRWTGTMELFMFHPEKLNGSLF